MMFWGKVLKEHKDDIASLAALSGLVSALLYVFGFIAERVHWNFLGLVEPPANHIEFLYRGGIVFISCLAALPLYLVSIFKSFDIRTSLIVATIVTIIIGIHFNRIPKSILKTLRLRYPYIICCVGFFLLLILLVNMILDWPSTPKDLLFQKNVQKETYIKSLLFREHVGISALWLIFYLSCNRIHTVTMLNIHDKKNSNVNEKELSQNISRFLPIFQLFKRTSFIILIILFIFLPFSYGSNQYSHVYPIVQIVFINDSPKTLQCQLNGNYLMALLYETHDDYVLYTRTPNQSVFKVKKSIISALVVHRSSDIMDDCSFQLK